MNKLLLLLCAWLISGNLSAQVQWGHHIGSQGRVNLQQHTVDQEGNIVAVGYFEGTVTIGREKLTSMGSTDMVVYKANPEGEILWVKALNSPSHAGDMGVGADKSGNIYIAGGFVRELYTGGKLLLKGNNYWSAFLIKMDEHGQLKWTEGVLGNGDFGEARNWGTISVNGQGEVAIGINFTTQAQLKHLIFKSGEAGGSNLLLAKFSTDGALQWYVHPPLMSNTQAHAVHLADNGKVYLTGFYTNSIKLGQHHIKAPSPAHSDIFLAKFDKEGQIDWLKGFNKTTAVEINNIGRALYVDPSTEEVYLTGIFKGSVDFDGIVIEGINTSEDPGNPDIFLTRLAADGAVVWAKRFGSDYNDQVWDLKQDAAGNMMIAGAWRGNPAIQLFDKNGKLGEYISLNAPGTAHGVTPLKEGGYYLSGNFYGHFDEGAISWFSEGGQDGFLVKIAQCQAANLPQKPALSASCSAISVTGTIAQGSVKWFRNGVEVKSTEPYRLISPTTGVYQVGFENNCGITLSEPLHFDNTPDLPPSPILRQVNCRTLTVDNQAGYTISWYKSGVLIPNATGTSLDIQTGGEYLVRFENQCGSSYSSINAYASNPVSSLVAYNVITPNGDGKNDHFVLDPALAGAKLQIYNRWGSKVYDSKHYANDWSGTGLPEAVYHWVATHDCAGTLRGTVTIIR